MAGGHKDAKAPSRPRAAPLNDYPYGFASRFEASRARIGRLIGAAHAACFTMALSLILGEAKAHRRRTWKQADVTLEKVGEGSPSLGASHAEGARSPARTMRKVSRTAALAKAGWPVRNC